MDYRGSCQDICKKFTNKKNATQLENKIFTKSNGNQNLYYKMITEAVIQLKQGNTCKIIAKFLDSNEFDWNHKDFDDIKKRLNEQDNFTIKPFEVDEGVLECRKCGSKKTFSYTKQTRGGDEATTVFAVCSECNNRWKHN